MLPQSSKKKLPKFQNNVDKVRKWEFARESQCIEI